MKYFTIAFYEAPQRHSTLHWHRKPLPPAKSSTIFYIVSPFTPPSLVAEFFRTSIWVLHRLFIVRRGDIIAAWSGIRPLVVDPSSKDTKSVSRNHVIEVSENNLITIAGGKWTTYRAMASDTVDAAIKACNLSAGECQTNGLMLEGGDGWTPTFFIRLVQDYGLEPEVRSCCGTVPQHYDTLLILRSWCVWSCFIWMTSLLVNCHQNEMIQFSLFHIAIITSLLAIMFVETQFKWYNLNN